MRVATAAPPANVELSVEVEHCGGQFLQQPPERLHDTALIPFAVIIHPFLAILPAQVAEKLKGRLAKYR